MKVVNKTWNEMFTIIVGAVFWPDVSCADLLGIELRRNAMKDNKKLWEKVRRIIKEYEDVKSPNIYYLKKRIKEVFDKERKNEITNIEYRKIKRSSK